MCHDILAHEVLTWRLKRRVLWIEQGDANTKLFHNFASPKHNNNNIWELMDGEGKMVSNMDLNQYHGEGTF